MSDIFNINKNPEMKAQPQNNNSQVLLMNNKREIDSNEGLLKTMYPIYLYKPPFGYPRNVNVVFLRELAKNPYVFAVIKAITDQAAETKWEIKPKDDVEMTEELEKSKKYITEFFKNPNSENESFAQLLRKIINDILVLDSGCFVKVYNIKKELVQLRVLDGGAILKNPDPRFGLSKRESIIFDDGYFDIGAGKGFDQQKKVYKAALDQYESYGYTDQAAYFQFAYGVNYSVPIPYGKDEIIYIMENPASETVYSRGSALQSSIDITLNLIYSSKASLDLFLNANIPNGIIQLAEAQQEDTQAFQDAFYNQQYSGVDEYGFQRKVNGRLPVVGNPNVNFIPLQFKTNESEVLQIQEWFTKVLWMCFGVNASEMGFTQGDSRATDQSQSKVAARKAVKPRLSLVANYLNDQILPELPMGDLFEFCFDEYDIEEDRKKWDLYKVKIDSGAMSPEMVARKEGIDVDELKKDMAERQQAMAENTEYDNNSQKKEDKKNNETEVKSDYKHFKLTSIYDNKDLIDITRKSKPYTEVKSTYDFGENIVITGKNKEDLLRQAVELCENEKKEQEQEDTEQEEESTGPDKPLKEIVYEGAREYNEEIETAVGQEEEPEMKANKFKEFPKKTATESVMVEFEKEYNEMVKTAINKIVKE